MSVSYGKMEGGVTFVIFVRKKLIEWYPKLIYLNKWIDE